jgi:hypothetical protein
MGVTLEKNAGLSPLGAWVSELILKPTITFKHKKMWSMGSRTY